MNITGDSLFRLVKTMTEREQKEFREMLERNPGGDGSSSYQRLYEQLISADFYREKEIKERLKKYIAAKSFPVIKNHLREKVLDFLRKKAPLSGGRIFHELLDEIEVLYNRGLYEEAWVLCDKAIQEAERHAHLHFILEVNRWRTFIAQRIIFKDLKAELDTIRKQSMETLHRMELIYQIGSYYLDIQSHLAQHLNIRNKHFCRQIQQWMQHPYFKLSLNDKRLGFYGKCYLAMAKNMLYKVSGEFEKSYEMERVVWRTLQSDWPFYYQHKKQESIAAMCNYLDALSKTNRSAEMKAHLDFISGILSKDRTNIYIEAYYMVFKLDYLVRSKNNSLTANDLVEFEQYYLKLQQLPFLDILRTFEGYLASAYYYLKNYEKATFIERKTIDSFQRTDIRPDQFENAKFSYFVFYFTHLISKRWEAKEVTGFISQINSYYECIRKKPVDDDYRLELLLVSFFRKFTLNSTKKEILKHLHTLEPKLKKLFTRPNPYLALIAIYFDEEEWIACCKKYLQTEG